ncbi:hypothetical protein [Micromonospora sp. DT31]|uniref:hypothetical protein n=1 Tax=Micromonospora sp. DT31 TaxID=3393434 RepID=UPI003CF60B89
MPQPRFQMVISHVFRFTGRPVIVSGPCGPTGLRQGDLVEVLHDGKAVATTRAFVELHSHPGTASLVLPDLAGTDVQPGHALRAAG